MNAAGVAGSEGPLATHDSSGLQKVSSRSTAEFGETESCGAGVKESKVGWARGSQLRPLRFRGGSPPTQIFSTAPSIPSTLACCGGVQRVICGAGEGARKTSSACPQGIPGLRLRPLTRALRGKPWRSVAFLPVRGKRMVCFVRGRTRGANSVSVIWTGGRRLAWCQYCVG